MKVENLITRIKNSSLAGHEDFLRSLVKPVVNIKRVDTPITSGTSKFGGYPDAPKDFMWPTHEHGSYRFLCQINFAQIKDSPSILPKNGLLSLFVADKVGNADDSEAETEDISEDEPESFWGEPGYVIGFYFKQGISLSPLISNGQNQLQVAIDFESTIDLPFEEELIKEWPLNEEQMEDLFCDIRRDMEREGDYLLGYPQYQSLAYNPTPKGDWISLINLNSDPTLEWCWHDEDRLMVFIEPSKLQTADFSNLKSDAG